LAVAFPELFGAIAAIEATDADADANAAAEAVGAYVSVQTAEAVRLMIPQLTVFLPLASSSKSSTRANILAPWVTVIALSKQVVLPFLPLLEQSIANTVAEGTALTTEAKYVISLASVHDVEFVFVPEHALKRESVVRGAVAFPAAMVEKPFEGTGAGVISIFPPDADEEMDGV